MPQWRGPMSEPLLAGRELTKRFGGFIALNDRLAARAGRAPRPDRAERRRQEHAGQLHFRHCCGTKAAASISPAATSPACRRIAARGSASRAVFKCRARSAAMTRGARISRSRCDFARGAAIRRDRRARLARPARPRRQGADALPGALTQVELRKLELARALAAQPRLVICRRSHGRPVACRGR